MTAYIALLEHEDGRSFGVWFPDFPGCVSSADTAEEAMRSAQEALTGHVRLMIEDGDEIPAPRSLEDVLKDPESAGQVPFLVNVETERARQVRINISLDERLVKRIDLEAERIGKTRSGFIADAARRVLVSGE